MLRGNWSNRITAASAVSGIAEEGFDGQLALLRPQVEEALADLARRASASAVPPLLRVEAEPEVEDLVLRQSHHAAVPPTVSPSISRVGWPTPAGTDWPPLPQMPTPSSSAMSLPMPCDPGQHGRAVADQGRALDRRAELAVLDPVGLGAGEDELAAGDVDLAAAEALGVDAVLRPGRASRPGSSLPPSMKVLVMRGIGAWAKLSRRPLPVGSTPISRALSRSWI